MLDRRFVRMLGATLICAVIGLVLPVATIHPAQAQAGGGSGQQEKRDYLEYLNLRLRQPVAQSEKAYPIYFAAYELLDVSDDRMVGATVPMDPYSDRYKDALAWAGAAPQQAAVKKLLGKNDRGFNATELKVFGLPYGTKGLTDDMLVYDFAEYVHDGNLWDRDPAYLTMYKQVMSVLRAEAFRRGEEGDTRGASEAMLGLVHMGRHLCDREFIDEKSMGMDTMISTLIELRQFMWYFRTKLTVEDLKYIAQEVDRMQIEDIEFPGGEELLGEQLMDKLFKPDYSVDTARFASTMASLETVHDPLARFQSMAFWKEAASQASNMSYFKDAVEDVSANWRLRWRLPLYDQLLSSVQSEYEKLDGEEFAAVKVALGDPSGLFFDRIRLLAQQHGTATAAGVQAFIRREGGDLKLGEIGKPATVPVNLAQVQPAYVKSKDMLIDTFDSLLPELRYDVVQKQNLHLSTFGYDIHSPDGEAYLPELWPILYSIGPDGTDNIGDDQMEIANPTSKADKGDVIFFPCIEFMIKEANAKGK